MSTQGNAKELEAHCNEQVSYHLKLIKRSMKQFKAANEVDLMSRHAEERIGSYDKKVVALRSEIEQLRAEVNSKIHPVVEAVMKMESAVKQLQEGFGEMALLVQTLQATSYNGVFIWKIPEVQRRRQEAKVGRTISLYSAPFYTSRHGYKLCLRLYMDGDGSGKGNHLSFFLTIMRGEFDALLPWPFKQTVSLILLDQDKQRDIIQSFRPEPSSSSFQRPRLEMNVASGCPTFAPLSVLNSTSYVKDNTMFLKCIIDRSGLENT